MAHGVRNASERTVGAAGRPTKPSSYSQPKSRKASTMIEVHAEVRMTGDGLP